MFFYQACSLDASICLGSLAEGKIAMQGGYFLLEGTTMVDLIQIQVCAASRLSPYSNISSLKRKSESCLLLKLVYCSVKATGGAGKEVPQRGIPLIPLFTYFN